jgi:hypothetical protein
LSVGSQGILFPNESNGITTDPGKGVGDGISVAVAVGSGVNVGGIGEGVGEGVGVNVDGTGVGVGAGAHALTKTVRRTNARNFDPIDFFMTLSPRIICSVGTSFPTVDKSKVSGILRAGSGRLALVLLAAPQ